MRRLWRWLFGQPAEPRYEAVRLCKASNKVWQEMGAYALVAEQQVCNLRVNHTGPHVWLSVWKGWGDE